MAKMDDESKKILVGALIGAALGIAAYSLIKGMSNHDKEQGSGFNIGKTISQMGEILACFNHDKPLPIFKDVEKKIVKEENNISDILEWAVTGVQLWKKIKEGR